MDDTETLRLERCARCQAVFWICRRCYRGHGFCGLPCKLVARVTSKRRARALHRQSPEGRLDHRDRERDRRRRARDDEVERVADHTPRFLAAVARVCPPADAPTPIPGAVVVDGQGHDELRTDGASRDDSTSELATPTPTTLDTAPVAMCRLCGRPGLVVTAWPRRGSRCRRDRSRVGRGP